MTPPLLELQAGAQTYRGLQSPCAPASPRCGAQNPFAAGIEPKIVIQRGDA
jgi:hypothetical protein